MAKRSKKSSGIGWIAVLALVAFCAAAALAYYMTKDGGAVVPPPRKQARVKPPVITQVPLRTITVFIPAAGKDRFYLVPEKRTTDKKGNNLDVAVQVLLDTTKEKGEAGRLIPQGTKLKSPVKVQERIATVDLSKEFIENFSGGSTQEALTLNSVAFTLVRNSGGTVDEVQILVEGSTVDTLSGHFEIEEPIKPDLAMLN